MSETFAIGQRWISDTESDLGLGTILDVEFRQITIVFLATGDTRIYAKETAPLTRVEFAPGDAVTSHEGWQMKVDSISESGGLLSYSGHRDDTGDPVVLDEANLDNHLQFRVPKDRLFRGLLDGQRWYAIRRQVFEHRHYLAHSPARGLMGARVSVLPHQIYIAVEGMQREYPRLLLADEVGLGKTIEAGLILHARIARRQASRILIVVPEPLLHQWLVEMLRKFNLSFSIMDEERFAELVDVAPDGNPFLAEQLVLCSMETLMSETQIGDAALEAGWDMLIADEAHHLVWKPDEPSDQYLLVESLSLTTPSVLLLTATPEQLGKAGHFARLRLLDPERFTSLEAWEEQEASYTWVAAIADKLSREEALETSDIDDLESLLGEPFDESSRKALGNSAALAMSEIGRSTINKLVDRHGTGRLLFRNTRRAISGFPERQLVTHELDDDSMETLTAWLMEFVASQFPNKILFIASELKTVRALAELLRIAGLDTAQFHEEMSIVERDRAAAWFADPEESCRLMLCSEIGSEGRNFQFLHQLVTMQLPVVPDLLEQRIGRLDRIGQSNTIEIHVPTAPGSMDHALMRWYHEGLNSFENISRTSSAVVQKLGPKLYSLLEALDTQGDDDDEIAGTVDETALQALIDESRTLSTSLESELDSGRDRLLELNSNRPERIQEHLDALARTDRDYRLQDFMEAVFDRFGVEVNEQRDHWILHPSDHMQVEHFPYLSSSGMTITFDRTTALTREDFTYMSWDHPMVTASMDLILDEGYGQADAQVIKTDLLTKGLTIIEASYVLQSSSPAALNVERYLPVSLQTYRIGLDSRDYTTTLEEVDIDSLKQRYDRNALRQVIQKHRPSLEKLIDYSAKMADQAVPAMVEQARADLDAALDEERERLVALARVNPLMDEAEIDALDERRRASHAALESAHARPVGVRVLFNS